MMDYEQLQSVTWDLLIYDECHYLKNKKSIKTKLTKKLKANKYLYLSATPLTNDAADLWSILNLIDSKRFSGYWTFAKYFANVIETDFGTDVKGYRADRADDYTWLLKRYSIRRCKETAFEQIKTYHRVRFTESQKKLYKEAEKQWLYGDNVISTPAEKFIRLCQISVSPQILRLDGDSEVDNKVIELLTRHLNNGIRKIIVGCSSKEHTYILQKMIADEFDNINVYRIDGEVKSKTRKEIVDNFKADIIDSILVATVTSIAEGISIDECDHMIIADYSFKQDKNHQFECRIFRPQTVTRNKYYDIIIADKVGREKITALKLKQEMVDCIFDGKVPTVSIPNDVQRYVANKLKYEKGGF
jgi:SNF2 family DNA or RNA helicase